MNILFVLQRYPGFGGIETVTKLLSEEFCKIQGFNVTVFSTAQQDNPSQLLLMPNWELVLAQKDRENQKKQLDELVEKKKIDVVIYQDSYVPEGYLIEGLRQKGIKVIVCEHNTPDALLIGYRNAYKEVATTSLLNCLKKCRRLIRYFQVRGIAKKHHHRMLEIADKYVLLSDSFKDILKKEYHIDTTDQRLASIGNPVSLPIGKLQEKEKEALFIGRLTGQKGTDYLVQIWCSFARRHPDWTLTIVGDGEERERMENTFKREGIQNVKFEGYCADVLPFYKRASILLLTSVYEGFGMVLLEAMSQGCVPFAFKSYSSVFDIIEDERSGYLVNAFDVGAFVHAIERFAESPKAQQAEARRAALTKASNNTPAAIAKKWIDLIHSII